MRGGDVAAEWAGKADRSRLSAMQWGMSPSMHEMCSMEQICSPHYTILCHSTATITANSIQYLAYLTHLQQRPRSALRFWMCPCAISASSMASKSTPQVGGWRPLPSTHLVRPACTAASSNWGLSVKHVSIVEASSHTPSRTALPLPAALLLTCFLKSLR